MKRVSYDSLILNPNFFVVWSSGLTRESWRIQIQHRKYPFEVTYPLQVDLRSERCLPSKSILNNTNSESSNLVTTQPEMSLNGANCTYWQKDFS